MLKQDNEKKTRTSHGTLTHAREWVRSCQVLSVLSGHIDLQWKFFSSISTISTCFVLWIWLRCCFTQKGTFFCFVLNKSQFCDSFNSEIVEWVNEVLIAIISLEKRSHELDNNLLGASLEINTTDLRGIHFRENKHGFSNPANFKSELQTAGH